MSAWPENSYMHVQTCPPYCGRSVLPDFPAAHDRRANLVGPDLGAAMSRMRWLAFAVAAIFLLIVWGSRR